MSWANRGMTNAYLASQIITGPIWHSQNGGVAQAHGEPGLADLWVTSLGPVNRAKRVTSLAPSEWLGGVIQPTFIFKQLPWKVSNFLLFSFMKYSSSRVYVLPTQYRQQLKGALPTPVRKCLNSWVMENSDHSLYSRSKQTT